MRPEQVLPSSNKTVLWQCNKGHVWRESPLYRVRKIYGCPTCTKKERSDASRKATNDFNLQTENPTVCKEWHFQKNCNPPSFYMPGSNDIVWWACCKGHEWQASICARTKPDDGQGSGCPYCSKRRASTEHNLALKHPEIAAEWHPTKNDLHPAEVTPASSQIAWWLCERGHEWKTDVGTRTLQGTGCPKCSNQSSKNEIRILTELQALLGNAQSRHKVDGLEVDIYLCAISCAIEYDGKYWHQDKQEKDSAKQAALAAKGIKVLRVREAPLAALSDEDIVIPAGALLSKAHLDDLVLRLDLDIETKEKYISQKRFINENEYREFLSYFPSPFPEKSLASVNPTLAEEWHPTRNNPLTPSNFTSGSGNEVWWQCKHGHEWKVSISARNFFGTKCPFCIGRKATVKTCMTATRPDMAAVWHPVRNGDATPENTKAGSGIRRWWVCLTNPTHEWQQTPDKLQHLHSDNFCPHCRKDRNPPLSFTHPQIAMMWHPTKNGKETPDEITSGSSSRRWWVCSENPKHEWQNSPSNLTKPERKLGYCPFCSGRRIFKG
jgi:very-short-patch-repair endonuclease